MSGPQCVWLYCTPRMLMELRAAILHVREHRTDLRTLDTLDRIFEQAHRVFEMGDTDMLVMEDCVEVRNRRGSEMEVSAP